MGKKLVILSGPSCVGKGTLRSALRRLHPEIRYAEPVLCHSRRPRLKRTTNTYEIHGVDYYFLPRGIFQLLDPRRFLTIKIRSEYQALDLAQIEYLFEEFDMVVTEAYPSLARLLTDWAKGRRGEPVFAVTSVFLSPLSQGEVESASRAQGISAEEVVYQVMMKKIARRREDALERMEERARSAFWEIQQSVHYDHCIVSHAGEDDLMAWKDPLSSEAQRALDEFVQIILK